VGLFDERRARRDGDPEAHGDFRVSARRWGLPAWVWAALVVAVVATFATGLASRSSGGAPASVAPAWSGTAIDGTSLSSNGERGRWVVLNFFATWCGPCVAETPQLVRFAADHRPSPVQVVGVIFDDPVSGVRSFAKANDVTWPLLSDPGNRISTAYRVDALPQSFVIRPNGTLAAHLYGGVTAAGLERVIDG